MKVIKGIQKLGKMKGSIVSIDWSYLIEQHGLRKEHDDMQKSLGNLLRYASIISIVLLIVIDFSIGEILPLSAFYPDRIIEFAYWGIIFIFVYSVYLLRDREVFLDTIEHRLIDELRKLDSEDRLPKEVEISDYFDYDLLYILDDVVKEYDREFLVELLARLVELPKVKELIMRLGLPIDQFDKIIHQVYVRHNTSLDMWLAKLMFDSFVLAYKKDFQSVDERVMFLQLCKTALAEILLDNKVMQNEVDGLLLWASNEAKKKKYKKLWREKAGLKPKNTVNRSFTSRLAATLEQFKRDFTLEVIRGQYVMSIARESELDELVRLLHQGEKGAVLITGAPGIGKTTLIKNLALRMVVEDVPKELKDMRLVGFDFNRAFAQSGSIDRFKEVIENVLVETSGAKNIILVIDDFDDLVNIREEYAGEVINLIVSAADQYNLRILATSTVSGYISSIKPNKDLVTKFDVVRMNEPSDEVSMQILIDQLKKLEQKYRVRVSFDAIRKIVKLSRNFDFDRVLPEKGIDLLEESIVYAREQGLHFLSEENIEKLVSKKVGVNIGAISGEEQEELQNLEEKMHKRVVGQDKAIEEIANALRRSRSGLVSGDKPVASFLFFGPTGVGKTEVAKTLAATYYGDEEAMIRIDMSEYHEADNLKRLIGYRQGDDFYGGYLTEAVREKPFSLVLLDEMEKANPKVLDLFLQILDEGKMTDGVGREVVFSNTIIIATSNAGSKKIAKLLEGGKDYKQVSESIQNDLREVFRVEFLNRFDRVIMFKPLVIDEIKTISGLMLKKVSKKLAEKGIKISFSDIVLSQLSKIGYNPVYGAREMRRVIQENIEDDIASLIVSGKVDTGGEIIVNALDDFKVKK